MNGIGADAALLGLPPAVVASLLAAAMASVGIVTVSLRPGWAQKNRSLFAALASGVLLSTALFLLPEAFAGSAFAPIAVLGGYFFLFVIGRFARRSEGRAITAFFAIAAHSTIDGLEYGLLFSASEAAGLLGAGGLILHEFSEGVLLFLILRTGGVQQLLAMVLALFGAALTTPLGAFAATSVVPSLSPETFSVALAFAAGALLFVGASQLPAEFGDLPLRPAILTYACGAVLAVLLLWTSHGLGGGSTHHHDTGLHPEIHDE